MDKQAQSLVLDNIRSQVANRWPQIVAELRSYGDQDLRTFLREADLGLADVLREGKKSWTQLRRDAGLPTPSGAGRERHLLKRVRAFAHVDDVARARGYRRLLADEAPTYATMTPAERRIATMLVSGLWPDGGDFDSPVDALAALRNEHAARAELSAVVDLSFDGARHVTLDLAGPLAELPLKVHARYQREEILAALDFPRHANSFREGVWYSSEHNADALFITLKKSEASYSPTTMYRDYPISPMLFHWESQSTTSENSPTGRRYLTGTSHVLLFVREQQREELGTSPYMFLGLGHYASHQGSRPIAITWRLEHAMPAEVFNSASVAAV